MFARWLVLGMYGYHEVSEVEVGRVESSSEKKDLRLELDGALSSQAVVAVGGGRMTVTAVPLLAAAAGLNDLD
jgi:hypothetical protein